MRPNALLGIGVLSITLTLGACAAPEADEDDTSTAESGLSSAPAPSGRYRVTGVSRSSVATYVSINGGREESTGGSGVSGDGYYSWNTDAYDVVVQPNPDGSLAVTIGGVTGTLRQGVNFYAGNYSGQLGTSANGYRITSLTAARWNNQTNIVSDVRLELVATKETISTRTYWERNPKGPPDRQVTSRTRESHWKTFQTGGRPGFHR